jgi:hypothetical protein
VCVKLRLLTLPIHATTAVFFLARTFDTMRDFLARSNIGKDFRSQVRVAGRSLYKFHRIRFPAWLCVRLTVCVNKIQHRLLAGSQVWILDHPGVKFSA